MRGTNGGMTVPRENQQNESPGRVFPRSPTSGPREAKGKGDDFHSPTLITGPGQVSPPGLC